MNSNQLRAIEYAHQHQSQFLESLKELLRIPSISNKADNQEAMLSAAHWLTSHLMKIGFHSAEVVPTQGHPAVIAEYRSSVPGAQTILIYGHYDVQPVDPINEWKTDPFVPTLNGESLFARGASDMKGQIMASMHAAESILSIGDPGINIKYILEGEEEIGSDSLPAVLKEKKAQLKCDAILNVDSTMFSKSLPAITYGLRGIAYFELHIYGPEADLHSGSFGGIVHNPAQALCELITKMHDENGKVTLPGFYDKVLPLSDEERTAINRLPVTDQDYMRDAGVSMLWGERDFSPTERLGARPTLEVNGMLSGFTEQGSKTVIPAYAMAKISMRLVPNQDPHDVQVQLEQFLRENAPKTIRWELIPMHGGFPVIANRDHPATRAITKAFNNVWGVEPAFIRIGGSIPIVSEMKDILEADSVITGFGLPDDHIHSPNEKLDLPTWYKGIDALIQFFYIIGNEK